jgi:hypothetical protein
MRGPAHSALYKRMRYCALQMTALNYEAALKLSLHRAAARRATSYTTPAVNSSWTEAALLTSAATPVQQCAQQLCMHTGKIERTVHCKLAENGANSVALPTNLPASLTSQRTSPRCPPKAAQCSAVLPCSGSLTSGPCPPCSMCAFTAARSPT